MSRLFQRWGPKGTAARLGALALAGGLVWWSLAIPYRPGAVYESLPSNVSVVTRHADVAERLPVLADSPSVRTALRPWGVTARDLRSLKNPGTLAWVRRLTGREAVLAYRPASPGPHGAPDALLGVAWLGGGAQWLRWQLQLFRPSMYVPVPHFPGHSVWRVEGLDLPDGAELHIAFDEGKIFAAVSRDPYAIGDLLAAREGQRRRLVEASPEFRAWAGADDRTVPDRVWWRPDHAADFAIDGDAFVADCSLAAFPGWFHDTGPVAMPSEVVRRLGDAPCATLLADQHLLSSLAWHPGIQDDVRFACRLALRSARSGPLVAALCDGAACGHVAFGPMRRAGLTGLRVPTLVLATPMADEAALRRVLRDSLDASNARYRAAFVERPAGRIAGAQAWTFESAGGDEWVDLLDIADRPAGVILDGWLYVGSNFAGLKAALESGREGAPCPGLAETPEAPLSLWLHPQRAGKVATDLAATWRLARRFIPDAPPADWLPAVESTARTLGGLREICAWAGEDSRAAPEKRTRLTIRLAGAFASPEGEETP